MDNLISETNNKLQVVSSNLETIKEEYKKKLENNTRDMATELDAVKKYKEEFFAAKKKIEKMNADIEGFEQDYQNLVERFKDDELANILIAANKEISAKIEERKRKIIRDKKAMNELVAKAEIAKEKLVKLNAEKAALELCLNKITDVHEFYSTAIDKIIAYTEETGEDLSKCFHPEEIQEEEKNLEFSKLEDEINKITVDDNILEDDDDEEEEQEVIEKTPEETEIVPEEEEEVDEIVIEEEDLEDDDEDDDKGIIMESVIDLNDDDDDDIEEDEKKLEEAFNITDKEIEDSIKDLENEIINNDDELEEDDSLYTTKKKKSSKK